MRSTQLRNLANPHGRMRCVREQISGPAKEQHRRVRGRATLRMRKVMEDD
jgi:hypothetical protein